MFPLYRCLCSLNTLKSSRYLNDYLYFSAIQKAIEEWKAKKEQRAGKASSDKEEDDEENIYAVEKDVSNVFLIYR